MTASASAPTAVGAVRFARMERRAIPTRRVAVLLSAVAVLASSGSALAARPAQPWLLTGASSVPVSYWQGLTSDSADANLFFVGVFQGLWRTTPQFRQTAGVGSEIPSAVTQTEGYNHIGDPTWNPDEGGRVLLPMECFVPGVGNTCSTGAFGVADPATLAFRYYVKLDPAEIPKAMWAETSPDGSLVWTSSGDDLLAYRSTDISRANAGPSGGPIRAVRRLVGAVPPSGVTGAVFHGRRLLLAGEDAGAFQVWSVDTETGARRLEIQTSLCGESEGLDVIATLGGELHWLIGPFDPGCQLTFGPTSALLHYVPTPAHERYQVEVTSVQVDSIPGDVSATVRASRDGHPLRQARVSFAGATARTDKDGVATVSTRLEVPGRFRALVENGQNYGISPLVAVGVPSSSRSAAAVRSDRR
jgi:hypothetical protein